jgi:hypothetical protein
VEGQSAKGCIPCTKINPGWAVWGEGFSLFCRGDGRLSRFGRSEEYLALSNASCNKLNCFIFDSLETTALKMPADVWEVCE